jgi:hypothetical protein
MGILDEAIREHLELKRAHGADDSELKQLEDQAFGPPERPGAEAPPMPEGDGEGAAPDPAAEAPTEFMSQPDLGAGQTQPATEEPAALNQEPPPVRREPAAGMADIQEPPSRPEEEADEEEAEENEFVATESEEPADEPVAEEQSAAEHEAIPSAPVEHSTEERHAIADQPTQMFDVEEEFAATEAPAPPDEELVAEEINEARLGPAEPVGSPPQPPVEDEDDDFFDEQRLSDELDQALEAPLDRDDEPISEEQEAVAAHTDEHEAVRAETDEHEAVRGETTEHEADRDEDVLEETPDFLEETPEDDQLWFEQKPPKDFDFDD